MWDFLRQIPDRATDALGADVTIVPISHSHDFRFNEAAMGELGNRKWVLVDMSEFSWDWDQKTSYLWGKDRLALAKFNNEEYGKFDDFVRKHPPALTFQRELLQSDRSAKVLPIEYTAWLPETGSDTKEDFLKRPLSSLFNWGRSSESRMYLHGAFFTESPLLGYDVISDWSHIEKALKENICGPMKVASIHVPHFARIDVREAQKFCRISKIGVILWGCGQKTFRDGENCQDFLMARPKSNLAWSHPWDESNSIVLPTCMSAESARDAVKIIISSLSDEDRLYDLYRAACENALEYRFDAYIRRWLLGNIERVI